MLVPSDGEIRMVGAIVKILGIRLACIIWVLGPPIATRIGLHHLLGFKLAFRQPYDCSWTLFDLLVNVCLDCASEFCGAQTPIAKVKSNIAYVING